MRYGYPVDAHGSQKYGEATIDEIDTRQEARQEAKTNHHTGASHQEVLAQDAQDERQAPLEEPWFPSTEDAIEANQAGLAHYNHPLAGTRTLDEPGFLESAVNAPKNHWYYGEDEQPDDRQRLIEAAAKLGYHVAQAQAFKDGNKRTARALTQAFLYNNGLGHISPLDAEDEEYADHLVGYGTLGQARPPTHSVEDTMALFKNRDKGFQSSSSMINYNHGKSMHDSQSLGDKGTDWDALRGSEGGSQPSANRQGSLHRSQASQGRSANSPQSGYDSFGSSGGSALNNGSESAGSHRDRLTDDPEWQITGGEIKEWTRDYLEQFLSSPQLPMLPERQSSIGNTTTKWEEIEPGIVFVQAHGGSVDDRYLAEQIVTSKLEAHGYERARFSFPRQHPWLSQKQGAFLPEQTWEPGNYGKGYIADWGVPHWNIDSPRDGDPSHIEMMEKYGDDEDSHLLKRFDINPEGGINPIWDSLEQKWDNQDWAQALSAHPKFRSAEDKPGGYGHAERLLAKTSNWNDIMAKAKRLIQSGNVTILRNGWNNIVGHIIGDHGEYDAEIGRDDPDSRAITQWTCQCPWSEYAFDRTRKWRKYEARPCAHVLSLFWQAQSTPLDEAPPEGQNPPPGQKGFVPQTPADIPPAGPVETPTAPMQSIQAPGQMPPPGQQGVIPPLPGNQLQLFPPGVLPVGQDAPPGSTVSVPGVRPQTPFQPVQLPSTYSSWSFAATEFNNGDMVRLNEAEYGVLVGKSEMHGAGTYKEIPKNSIGEVLAQDETTGYVEVLFEGPQAEAGELEPYFVKAYLDSSQISAMPGYPRPYERKR